jgi:hypothetical protein
LQASSTVNPRLPVRSYEHLSEPILLQASTGIRFVAIQKGPIVLALGLRYILIAG